MSIPKVAIMGDLIGKRRWISSSKTKTENGDNVLTISDRINLISHSLREPLVEIRCSLQIVQMAKSKPTIKSAQKKATVVYESCSESIQPF